jgi:phospholipase/carboxylesterase
MTRDLKAGRVEPRSGKVKSAVVFLHGYGADGDDLLGLAESLAPYLPDTLFLAPDGPEECVTNPFGRQWFPIPWLDGSAPAEAAQGFARASEDLNAYLDTLLRAEGLSAAQLALFGFSQGSMMAFQVAPRRAEALAGVVAFSGRLLHADTLAAEAISKPPMLVLHGNTDQIVPFNDMKLAADALVAAGFDTHTHVMKGTGHGISPDGLGTALAFLKDHLPA